MNADMFFVEQLKPTFKRGVDLVWKTSGDLFQTNVKWKVRHHSPSGMNIGYSGSGPADLALNAMAALFPIRKGEFVEKLYDGKVSRRAWEFHQKFKFKFLQNANRDAGRIEWAEIEAWLQASDNG